MAVVSVVPITKTNWALGSPWASRVSWPVSWAELAEAVGAGVEGAGRRGRSRSVRCRARSAGRRRRCRRWSGRPAAWAATASLSWVAPLTTAGAPKPVSEVPGETPRSPLRTEGPVLVTPAPLRTTKGWAVARLTGEAWAAIGTAAKTRQTAMPISAIAAPREVEGVGHECPSYVRAVQTTLFFGRSRRTPVEFRDPADPPRDEGA